MELPQDIFKKQKLQLVSSDQDFLSNYATNDPYVSERSSKKPVPVPPLKIQRKLDHTSVKSLFTQRENKISHQILRRVYQ
jgi:hypothetical protein